MSTKPKAPTIARQERLERTLKGVRRIGGTALAAGLFVGGISLATNVANELKLERQATALEDVTEVSVGTFLIEPGTNAREWPKLYDTPHTDVDVDNVKFQTTQPIVAHNPLVYETENGTFYGVDLSDQEPNSIRDRADSTVWFSDQSGNISLIQGAAVRANADIDDSGRVLVDGVLDPNAGLGFEADTKTISNLQQLGILAGSE